MVAKVKRMHLPLIGEGFAYVDSGTPYTVDTTPRFAPGTQMKIGNKTFVYAIAAGAIIPDIGAKQSLRQKIANCAVQANYAAGVTTITITSASTCTADELAGGEIVIFPAAGNLAFHRGIVSNTAMTATATLTIVLDSPTPCAITVGASAEAIASPYSAVTQTSNEWTPVMGMPTVPATTGQGLWLQVTGMSWCAPAPEVGAAANCIDVTFGGDAALRTRRQLLPGEQRAGMILATATSGNTQGAPFIMLSIDH